MSRLLIVEDSAESYELIRRALGTSIQVEWVKGIGDASRALDKKTYDLVLLDINLPDGDGYHLCSLMQTHHELKNTAVIFLSARATVPDKIMGFSVGADDFLAKPFDPIELKARVDARLRRREREKTQNKLLRVGDLEINKDTQKVKFVSDSGSDSSIELDLTPIEFKILLLLASNTNKVHTRDDVLTGVWGEAVFVYSRSVDTHVSKLRKKLGARANCIQSVHGSGYRFFAPEKEDGQVALTLIDETDRLSIGQT